MMSNPVAPLVKIDTLPRLTAPVLPARVTGVVAKRAPAVPRLRVVNPTGRVGW